MNTTARTLPIYEDGIYWASHAKCGFEVWRVEGTHSVRCATIGFKGSEGLERVKLEIARRKALAS
jgi:hypothetical protein